MLATPRCSGTPRHRRRRRQRVTCQDARIASPNAGSRGHLAHRPRAPGSSSRAGASRLQIMAMLTASSTYCSKSLLPRRPMSSCHCRRRRRRRATWPVAQIGKRCPCDSAALQLATNGTSVPRWCRHPGRSMAGSRLQIMPLRCQWTPVCTRQLEWLRSATITCWRRSIPQSSSPPAP